MTADELAQRVLDRIQADIVAELDASRATILGRLGVLERVVVNRNWGLIEEEVPRIVRASIAGAIRQFTGE